MEERLKSHYESLTRAIRFTRSTDTKAAPVLALQVALVGTLAARVENLWLILAQDPSSAEALVLEGLIALYVAFLIAATVAAASVYLPKNPRTGRSLIYFEDIGAMPLDSFQEQARQMDVDAIERQLLDQIHAVSQIVSAKMRRVRWAYYLSVPTIVLWVILLAWGASEALVVNQGHQDSVIHQHQSALGEDDLDLYQVALGGSITPLSPFSLRWAERGMYLIWDLCS